MMLAPQLRCLLAADLETAKAFPVAREWIRNERDPVEQRERRRLGRLRRLLEVAADRPYFSQRIGEARTRLAEGTIETVLDALPVLQKEEIRSSAASMLPVDGEPPGTRWLSTGGSTGEPLRIARTAGSRIAGSAAYLQGRSWHGLLDGQPLVTVRNLKRRSLLGQVRLRMLNEATIDPLGGASECLGSIRDQLRRHGRMILEGYPTALLELERLLRDEQPRFEAILSTGEMLYPDQKERLVRTFGGPVIRYYGSNEVTGLAFECEHGQYHIADEHVIVETVDDTGRRVWDEPGRILVTDLENHAIPVLRYEIGDVGLLTKTPCRCGRTAQVLAELGGRRQDVVRSRSGRTIPAIYFASRYRDLRGIRQYQVVQRTLDEVLVKFVASGPEAEVESEQICSEIRRLLGSEVRVSTDRRDTIPVSARGKLRLVVGLDPARTSSN